MFEDVKRVVGELKETDEDGWIHYKYYVRDIQDDTVIVEELYSGKLIGFPLSFIALEYNKTFLFISLYISSINLCKEN